MFACLKSGVLSCKMESFLKERLRRLFLDVPACMKAKRARQHFLIFQAVLSVPQELPIVLAEGTALLNRFSVSAIFLTLENLCALLPFTVTAKTILVITYIST